MTSHRPEYPASDDRGKRLPSSSRFSVGPPRPGLKRADQSRWPNLKSALLPSRATARMTRTGPQPSDGPDDPHWSPAERPALVLSRATARMTRTGPSRATRTGPSRATRTGPQPSDGPDDPHCSPAERRPGGPALVPSRATRTGPQPGDGPDDPHWSPAEPGRRPGWKESTAARDGRPARSRWAQVSRSSRAGRDETFSGAATPAAKWPRQPLPPQWPPSP